MLEQYKQAYRVQLSSTLDQATCILDHLPPHINFNPAAPKINVGTATGKVQQSTGTAELNIPMLPATFPKTGHVMKSFNHTLLGMGKICDADCRVEFTKDAVIVYNPQQHSILSGWRKKTGAKLWRISLNPDQAHLPSIPATAITSNLQAFSAYLYDLPSVEALVKYFHAEACFPVRDTWLKAIKNGNYASWPGLTHANATK